MFCAFNLMRNTMRLWLVRHGETEANVAGLYSGHAPTPLTENGIGGRKRYILYCATRHLTRCYAASWNARAIPPGSYWRAGIRRNTSYLSLMRCTSATGKCAITATSPMKMPKAMPHGVRTGRMRFRPMARFSGFYPARRALYLATRRV